MVNSPEMLNRRARSLIRDAATELCLSTVSAIEISVKYSIGKLRLHVPPSEFVPALLAFERVSVLPLEMSHAIRLATLPFHHRDPFDRLLIAQAQVENLPFTTSDSRLEKYDVQIIRASN
jgi:PIN domain nuclease of toxin-antitoxin system